MILIKQPTNLIKIYLRQLSVSAQKKHYSQKIFQFKYDIKKKWAVMKERIDKAKQSKSKIQTFPGNLKLVTK